MSYDVNSGHDVPAKEREKFFWMIDIAARQAPMPQYQNAGVGSFRCGWAAHITPDNKKPDFAIKPVYRGNFFAWNNSLDGKFRQVPMYFITEKDIPGITTGAINYPPAAHPIGQRIFKHRMASQAASGLLTGTGDGQHDDQEGPTANDSVLNSRDLAKLQSLDVDLSDGIDKALLEGAHQNGDNKFGK